MLNLAPIEFNDPRSPGLELSDQLNHVVNIAP